MEPFREFSGEFFGILFPLLIIMDPVGILPFFLSLTHHSTAAQRARIAVQASLTAAVILVVFSLAGTQVLRFFDIGLPAFQLSGGFIVFLYALEMLQLIPESLKATAAESESFAGSTLALVPLATPLLAGPGAITVVLAWRESPEHMTNLAPLVAAILAASLFVSVIFLSGAGIVRILGLGGIRVLTRIMGLLLSVIAVQFMVDGIHGIHCAPD